MSRTVADGCTPRTVQLYREVLAAFVKGNAPAPPARLYVAGPRDRSESCHRKVVQHS